MALEVSRAAVRRARIREELPTEHPQVLDDVAALLTRWPDPAEMSGDELAGSLGVAATIGNQIEAWLTAVAAEADARKVSQALCAGTTGTMVAAATNASPAAGSGIVGTGRALRDMPQVAQAYLAGRLGTRQVQALQHAAGRVENFAAHEQWLVEVAARVDPKELRRLLDELITQSLPDAPDLDLDAARTKRELSLSERPDGMWKIDGLLDPIAGTKLHDLLAPLMAKDNADDPRGPKQRRADALDDVVSLAGASRSPLGVSELTVLVDVDNLPHGAKAALEDGRLLGPDSFDLLSCTAAMTIVFGTHRPGGFVPLRLARSRRRASAAQWAALKVRDRGCIRCGKPPRYTHAHHIIHWKHGGLTDLSNLCLLCARCHHDLHLGYFTVVMGRDGIPVITTGRGPPGKRMG